MLNSDHKITDENGKQWFKWTVVAYRADAQAPKIGIWQVPGCAGWKYRKFIETFRRPVDHEGKSERLSQTNTGEDFKFFDRVSIEFIEDTFGNLAGCEGPCRIGYEYLVEEHLGALAAGFSLVVDPMDLMVTRLVKV